MSLEKEAAEKTKKANDLLDSINKDVEKRMNREGHQRNHIDYQRRKSEYFALHPKVHEYHLANVEAARARLALKRLKQK